MLCVRALELPSEAEENEDSTTLGRDRLRLTVSKKNSAKERPAAAQTCLSPSFRLMASGIAGRCDAYKRSTNTFIEWIGQKVPPKPRTVRALLTAVESLCANGYGVPIKIARQLRNAIELRKEVHCLYKQRATASDPGDERHAHFIEALEAAECLIARAVQTDAVSALPAVSATDEPDILAICNRFEGLAVDEAADAPAAEPAAVDPIALVGATVVVVGLVSRPDLNGQSGVVVSYVAEKGRYAVAVGGGEMMRLKPDNMRVETSMQTAEEEKYMMGETLQFEASCLLIDLKGVLDEVDCAWSEYALGRCSLLAATAATNACVRHGE